MTHQDCLPQLYNVFSTLVEWNNVLKVFKYQPNISPEILYSLTVNHNTLPRFILWWDWIDTRLGSLVGSCEKNLSGHQLTDHQLIDHKQRRGWVEHEPPEYLFIKCDTIKRWCQWIASQPCSTPITHPASPYPSALYCNICSKFALCIFSD